MSTCIFFSASRRATLSLLAPSEQVGALNARILATRQSAREGGAYRVNMGGEYIVSGSYTRLEEPAVLQCTWQWEHETLTTLLCIELDPNDEGGTDLVLVHSDFTDEADAEGTRQGWELSLDRLAQLLAG